MNPLAALARDESAAVLVTVAATRGSTPREPGAHMLVRADALQGTIGGGVLEQRAIEHARALLAHAAGEAGAEWSDRLTLGARFGQCCGGEATLLFEVLPDGRGAFAPVLDEPSCASTGSAAPRWVSLVTREAPVQRTFVCARQVRGPSVPDALVDRARDALREGTSTALLVSHEEREYLLDPLGGPRLPVTVFGAGHVGLALVEVLGTLPFDVTLIDDRPERLPAVLPANAVARFSRAPALEVDDVPPGSACLVMTYSHALDRRICEHLLARDDLRYVGLIGSGPKRRSFEQHWRRTGLAEERVARLVCPIGLPLPGVGKAPGMIAVAVAAQLIGLDP